MMNGNNSDDNADDNAADDNDDDNDDDNADDNADDIAQEIMMLLIGESSMSHAHLVNGAVVNVRARVRLIFIFFDDWICFVFITSLRNRCQCSSKGGAHFYLF